MPICEIDPWRQQYFAGVDCPADVLIPTEDADAWTWYPRHRWVYDKLALALSQGLDAGPHGTTPPRFPVFSKPIINMRGMGAGSRVVTSAADYERHHTPGHFWMTLLEGPHVSSDVALVDGRPAWWRHATGIPARAGMFDYWTVHAAHHPQIERGCGAWLAERLAGYTGMVNLETIGGAIIEVHLRFADQWPDLYGPGWVEAVVALYRDRAWRYADRDRSDGFSIALFGPKGRRFRHPPARLIEQVKAMPGVSSVQITFHEDRDPAAHSMPPGGFRLALINAFDLDAGAAAREVLRAHFLGAAAEENRTAASAQRDSAA
jgi:hypothetical protein